MNRPKLVTIAVSHYCEKARWALDRSGVAYEEEDHVPVLHLAHLRGRTTPILHLDDRVLGDSTDILAALEERTPEPLRLQPRDASQRDEALALEHRLDEELGPLVRRVAYFHLVNARTAFDAVVAARGRSWQRSVARSAPGVIAATLRRAFKLDAASIARAEGRLFTLLDDVSAGIPQGRWLVGDRFSIADLTLAALLAPMVSPPEHPIAYPRAEDVSASFVALRDRVAATPAGALALRAYREERGRRA